MRQLPDTANNITQGQNILNYIHSVSTDLFFRMMDDKPPGLSSIHISRQKEMRVRANPKNMTLKYTSMQIIKTCNTENRYGLRKV